MQNTAVKLTTIGLDERSIQTLRLAFVERCNNNCVIASENEAQVALVDVDYATSKIQLNEFRSKYPKLPIIAIGKGENNSVIDNAAYLSKPFAVTQLAETAIALANSVERNSMNRITNDKIEQAMRAIDAKGVAGSLSKRSEEKKTKTAINRTLDKKTDEMCFNPERFLLGQVVKANAKVTSTGKAAILNCWGDKRIILCGKDQTILTDLNDNQVRVLSISPFDVDMASPVTTRYTELSDNEIAEFRNSSDTRTMSREVFLWNLGFLTSRGRIAADNSVNERVYIRRWPNLTRMALPTNAMQIISYWIHQSCSLSELHEKLNVPLQDIFSVFTAAESAGLAGLAKRQEDEMLDVVDLQEHQKRNLFSSILGKLRGQEDGARKSA